MLVQICLKEEFEDTKRVIRIRISKKNTQHTNLSSALAAMYLIHLIK
jgi:hypothetical protein